MTAATIADTYLCVRCKKDQPASEFVVYFSARRQKLVREGRCKTCTRAIARLRSKETRRAIRARSAGRQGKAYRTDEERKAAQAQRADRRRLRAARRRLLLVLAALLRKRTCVPKHRRPHAIEYEKQRRHSFQVRARRRLQAAVLAGTITKPPCCELCGVPTAPCALHGHHENHTKPLDVNWLCARCHAVMDPAYGGQKERAGPGTTARDAGDGDGGSSPVKGAGTWISFRRWGRA